MYAHRSDSPFHAPASAALNGLIAGRERFAVPWPCVHEFLNTVTRPRVYRPPSTMSEALVAVQRLRGLSHCEFLAEGAGHLDVLAELALAAGINGPRLASWRHDIRSCRHRPNAPRRAHRRHLLAHGVRELWSADRDFTRFARLKVVNPLLA